MTETITKEAVLELLREVVDEEGEDFVYEQKSVQSPYDPDETELACVYVHEGKYDCIAARVLGRVGVSVETLSKYEKNSAISVVDGEELPFTDKAVVALNTAQIYQDDGRTWGEAIRLAALAGEEKI